MNIVLAPDGPLHAGATLARYHLWGEDPANRLADGALLRVLRYHGRLVPYAVRATGPVDDARLAMRIPGVRDASTGEAVAAEVRRIFGLHFDLSGCYRMAKGDAVLAALVEPLCGMRPPLAPTPLEMLVGSISAQQVNLQFAFACRARLVRRWGTPLTLGRHTVWAFPDGAALAQARLREFRAMKFSRRKGEYIRDLARAVVAGRLDLDALAAAPSETVIERLTQQRGLGRWTADWFLARCLGRGDVCPAGDLAVRRAFEHFYGRGRTLSEDAIRRRARAWGEYQNLAIHYLLAGMRLARRVAGGGARLCVLLGLLRTLLLAAMQPPPGPTAPPPVAAGAGGTRSYSGPSSASPPRDGSSRASRRPLSRLAGPARQSMGPCRTSD